jgi:hypothetical protein
MAESIRTFKYWYVEKGFPYSSLKVFNYCRSTHVTKQNFLVYVVIITITVVK